MNSYCRVTLISRCWDQITNDLMLCLQNAVSLVGGSTINGVSGWMKYYFCSSFPSAAISPYSKSVGGERHISSFILG